MRIFFFWIVLSFVVGFVGSGRKIGFWGAFFLSLLLSPLIGLIFTLVSKDKEDELYKRKVLEALKNQNNGLNMNLSNNYRNSNKNVEYEMEYDYEDLIKLKKLRNFAQISEEEYQVKKKEIENFLR